jgi:hypothetical protein
VDRSTVLWIAAIVAALVFLDLLIVEVRRIVRELRRIRRRVAAYGELPIVSLAATAPADVERLVIALDRIPPLAARAEAALIALRLVKPRVEP